MAKAKILPTDVEETVSEIVYPVITMPYVTDGVVAQVEGTFSPESLGEHSKYVKFGEEYGYFTRNIV